MAKFKPKDIDNYIMKLGKLSNVTEDTIKAAVEEGGRILADEMRKNINGIPTITRNQAIDDYHNRTPSHGLTKAAKQGLQDSFGVTPIREDSGEWNVHIGFDGYNSIKTKKYPLGQANQMIARSVEKGSSSVCRHPFVAPAIAAKKQECLKAMQQVIDDEFNKIMN